MSNLNRNIKALGIALVLSACVNLLLYFQIRESSDKIEKLQNDKAHFQNIIYDLEDQNAIIASDLEICRDTR
jgi:hypothetical protein